MPITYVRLVHSKPDPFSFRSPIEAPAPNNVLLFDPVAEATSTDLAGLYRLLDGSLMANDIIIFRGAGREYADRLSKDTVLHSLLRPGQAVGLISGLSEYSPGPSWYGLPSGSPPFLELPTRGVVRAFE